METHAPKAVFLSYASQDAEAARRMTEVLRAAGVEVWFDQAELRGGDAWDQKIRKQIQECALFVPVISAATQTRLEGYFRIEWKLAAQRTYAMAEARPFLLPVVIDATRDGEAHVPPEFKAVQWTRLPNGETTAAFVERVKALLASGLVAGFADPLAARADFAELKPGDRIGHYRLLEKIGEGGCGIVWRAEQEQPVHRRVALKVIKLGMDTKEVIGRFEAERQALALMDHPNIARVFDAGTTDTGRPFFVMELVRGVPITRFCDEHNLPTAARLELFIQVCHAIQHAHQKGIIHRDIKPSNILVALQDDAPVTKVIDFGIAKATTGRLTDQTVFTAVEQFIGTPAYMSPEQAEMSGIDVDTRSDIYSLGVLLYELLTGGTPFDRGELVKAGWDEMRRTIREKEPLRPSTRLSKMHAEGAVELARRRGVDVPRLIALVRGDLDWIVMKCLEKDRSRRYETASGLAQDIGRHLHSEPVAARPPSISYKARKFVRRNRLAVAAATAVVLALLFGIVGSTWQAVRARRAEREQSRLRVQAQANEQKALTAEAKEATARRQAQLQNYSAEMNLAHEAYADGRVARALSILSKHIPGPDQPEDLRGFEWRYLWRLCQEGDALCTFRSHRSLLSALAFTKEDRLVACGFDGLVRVLDIGTRQELLSFHTGAQATRAADVLSRLQTFRMAKRMAVSANGEVVAAGFENGTVTLWQTASREKVVSLPGKGPVAQVVLSADGKLLAIATSEDTRLWNAQKNGEVKILPGRRGLTLQGFSADGGLLVAGTGIGAVLWNISEKRELLAIGKAHTSATTAAALSPDCQTLATGSWDTSIKLWDVGSQELLCTLVGHRAFVWCLAFSPDGRTLASGSRDETVKLWDIRTRTNVVQARTLRGHVSGVVSLAFSPNGGLLASGEADGTVKVWPLTPGHSKQILEGHSDWVQCVTFAPHDDRLASTGFDGTIRLWNTDRREGSILVPTKMYDFLALAFSPDGKSLATGEGFWGGGRKQGIPSPGTVRLWDVSTGQETFTLPIDPEIAARAEQYSGHDKMEGRAVALSPDGTRLACGNNSGWIQIWDLPSMKRSEVFHAHAGLIHGMQYSPDGRWLATVQGEGATKLFDTTTWKEVANFDHDPNMGWGNPIAFSPEGTRLAFGSGRLRLWNMATKQVTELPEGHNGPIMVIRFSPDGKTIATGSMDHTVKLWSLATGQEVATLEGHTGAVSGLSFSSGGTMLASSSEDKTIRLWRAVSPEEAAKEMAVRPK